MRRPPLPPLPPPLRPGDRVRLVAASSALESAERLEAGISVLRRWGLEVEDPGSLVGRRWGYLAGTDQQRAGDLARHEREDTLAPLLACVRGGWGSARLLDAGGGGLTSLASTQWLLGFSDITSLLWARWARGCSGGIHGPLLTTLASEPLWSQERLQDLLFGKGLAPLEGSGWVGGLAEGPLLVANLTVATHLLGTPHLPELQGAIVVFEDVGEAPYRIERMLTHWRLCGALQQLAGIGWGSFSGCTDDDRANQPPDTFFTTEQVLRERTADLGIPVVAHLPVGHTPGNAALPLGIWARLDGSAGRLELEPTWLKA
ncbi:MAG: LD-carboxypeptidase [Cyanobacteriota bacterium]|jgi:muramoyltetrapeptide carboxypeptidase|nr:LD-carboxypeptidase [Cyanobacteriota bacterium]